MSRKDHELVEVLRASGFAEAGGPWFVQLWRSLDDLTDLARHAAPAGYTVRPTRADEVAARVDIHRRCWAPARIKGLLGLPVTGSEPGSSYSPGTHLAVTTTPNYRPELDLVAEEPDGTLAAYGIGWLDPAYGSVLFEPIGTDPRHERRGLARALCAEILRVAQQLGATQAVVGPRGDDAYPLPRRVYEGLGMDHVAQFVTFTRTHSTLTS